MKPVAIPLAAAALLVTACASSHGAGGSAGGPDLPPGSVPPAQNPCVQLDGTAVGAFRTVDGAYGPAGRLVDPPAPCAQAADFSYSSSCPAAHSWWFAYEADHYTAYGVAGGTWRIKDGGWDQQDDVDDLLPC